MITEKVYRAFGQKQKHESVNLILDFSFVYLVRREWLCRRLLLNPRSGSIRRCDDSRRRCDDTWRRNDSWCRCDVSQCRRWRWQRCRSCKLSVQVSSWNVERVFDVSVDVGSRWIHDDVFRQILSGCGVRRVGAEPRITTWSGSTMVGPDEIVKF